jgi:hypothetical protein
MAISKAKRDFQLLLDFGAKFFPVNTKKKIPLIKNWQERATSDRGALEQWGKQFPKCGWGIACGPSNLHVIDIDGIHGELSILDLNLELPATLEVSTQSGNRHLYYRGHTTSKNNALIGVDIKSAGGYVVTVGPGYEISRGELIADAPAWSVDLVSVPIAKRDRGQDTQILSDDEPADIARAERWLATTAPPSVEGMGGNDNAYRVACQVKDMGVSEGMCLDLMLGPWNDRCEPPWDFVELSRVVANAYQYSSDNQGSSSAHEDFEREDLPSLPPPEKDKPPLGDKRALLKWMNARHAKTFYGGKVLIWALQIGENGQREYTLCSIDELSKMYENHFVPIDDKQIPLGKWWRTQKNLLWSNGFSIQPDCVPGPQGMNKEFNIWCGWGIEPKPGDWYSYWKLIKALCADNETHIEYVLNWIALLLQKPTELHKVALVFRGAKGTGKSTLGLALKKAFGNHAAKADSADSITGRFNWHLKNKVFLLAEEVRWMQGKGGEGALKSLITDLERSYEPKGVNVVQGYNYVSMMITSNENWVVPASIGDERRFAVFNVSKCLIEDAPFWRTLYEGYSGTLKKEPIAAMMYDLLRRDISSFDPIRHAPKTEALAQQALESMNYIDQWWHEKLSEGVPPGLIGEPDEWQNKDIHIPTQEAYRDFKNSIPRGHVPSKESLGRRLADFGVFKIRMTKTGYRPYFWVLPRLDEARQIFSEVLGNNIDW